MLTKHCSLAEPISITCSSCKQVFSSSWVLLQHAQSVHGSKLYIDILNNEPSILPPIDGQTPGVPTVGGNLSSGINNSMGSSPLTPTHPALSLLRMPLHDRQFPASFLAAAAAAASRPIGASGAGASHSDIFSSASPSVLNHHHPVASLFADAHNLFSAAAASDTHSTRSSSGSRSVTGSSSLPPASGHQSSSITAFEPHLDFYSQRLRQLAGATSPGAARSSVSPVRKHTPPSYSSSMSSSANTAPNSSTVTITTTNTCDILGNSRASLSQQPPSSPKHKSCEFCGKTFRFMSNLIVHRRSHTGEKPYKCNICNHACTQASKLKRHMKTHLRSSQSAQCLNNVTSENTTDSTQSQPDSTGGTPTSAVNNNNNNVTNATTNGGDIDMDDEEVDDDDDEEDDDEEECGDEERDEEAADGDNSSVEMVAEDLSTSGGTEKKTNGMGRKSKESSKGMTAAEATTVQSLIGEVMENFGLSGIQQYNEAYKQALEERIKGGSGMGVLGSSSGSGSTSSGVKQERPSSSSSHVSSIAENGGSINSLLKQHQSPLLSHPNLSDFVGPLGACVQASNSLVAQSGLSSAFDHHNPFDPKRLKLDMVSAPSEPRDSLYAGLWLPSLANPFTTPFAHLSGTDATSALAAEMSRSKAISESAFNKSSTISSGGSPRPGPSLGSTPPSANRSSPSGATSGTSPTSGRKESGSRTRNDTCEYCGKVFKNCSNLTVHRRSHTGEKPYKCELCSYACAQSSKLTRHMKTHGRMGKDVYRCRFCDMPFSVPSTLEKHMRKCVVNQNNASGNASNLQLLPCLTSNASNSNDPGSDT